MSRLQKPEEKGLTTKLPGGILMITELLPVFQRFAMPTPAIEDYLKTIYKLSRGDSAASTTSIAQRLGVAAGSVTGMLKRLSRKGLVKYIPYYGARLTTRGEEEAVRMIRRHRVLELFLVDVLGYTWDRVHEEAEQLEHAVSDELIDRMAEFLGKPQQDPHGAPIPAAGMDLHEPQHDTLADLPLDTPAIVRRVSDHDPEALRCIAELGLLPGTPVLVKKHPPFDGPLQVWIGSAPRSITRTLAESIRVEPVNGNDEIASKPPDSSAPGETG